MKLKVLFITFNIVLFGLLFTIFFLPLFYADGNFIKEFWNSNWFFGPIFLLIIVTINVIFFRNKKTINAIENEDWASLSETLEHEIFEKKKLSFRNVRLLSEALLILSDFASMNRLEAFLQENKPSYISKLATKFVASKMLSGNFNELLEFTAKFNTSDENKDEWMAFYHAFSLQMMKDYPNSFLEFKAMQEIASIPLIKVLSSYFVLKVFSDYNDLSAEEVETSRLALKADITSSYKKEKWNRYIEKEKQEIHVMVLSKIIEDATAFFFA